MKQQINPGVTILIVLVTLLVIGFLGWRIWLTPPPEPKGALRSPETTGAGTSALPGNGTPPGPGAPPPAAPSGTTPAPR
jgi:hypothetical protein